MTVPPPTVVPEDSALSIATRAPRLILLSASMVTNTSPTAARAPALRILARFFTSSRIESAPKACAISSVLSEQRFKTTMSFQLSRISRGGNLNRFQA